MRQVYTKIWCYTVYYVLKKGYLNLYYSEFHKSNCICLRYWTILLPCICCKIMSVNYLHMMVIKKKSEFKGFVFNSGKFFFISPRMAWSSTASLFSWLSVAWWPRTSSLWSLRPRTRHFWRFRVSFALERKSLLPMVLTALYCPHQCKTHKTFTTHSILIFERAL